MFDFIINPVWGGVFFFWIGACFGSFANVIILRLPQGKSIVKPRSHCFSCQTKVSWFDNIPLVSWFVLMGKCRNCSAKISIRYFIVELLMALFFTANFLINGLSFTSFEYFVFIFSLVTVSFIDLDHMILPDVFTLSGIIIGLLGAVLSEDRTFWEAFLGVLMGGGFFWLVAYLYQLLRNAEGLGGGDIKLLGWIGAVLGWTAIPYVILVSSLLGSFIGLAITFKNKTDLKAVIPFGPFLSFAALSYVFEGKEIALWYLRFFFPWM